MAKNENFSRLDNTIESTAKDLRDNIDKLGGESVKRSELQYYATKHFVLSTAAFALALLCGAYVFVTPLLIDSKNSKIELKVYEALKVPNPADKQN